MLRRFCYNRDMNAPANIKPPLGSKIIKVGNSAGVILPKEVLAALGVELGDKLSFTKTPSGLSISKYDPDFAEKMSVAREVMKRRRNALRELAK